jgi:hypothetical protein
MKHTKGKWFVEKGWHKAESHIVANDKTIVICRTIEANIPIEEGEANAKLISKAPEMYEALKEIEKLCYGNIKEGLESRLDRIADLARKNWKHD